MTEKIYYAAAGLARELWSGEKVRMVAVRVAMLSDRPEYSQVSLFDDRGCRKKRLLDSCLDNIRDRYGNGSVFRGSLLAEGLERSRWYEDVFII